MSRDEFIAWLETTCFQPYYQGNDSSWKFEVDYGDMRYDFIDVDQETATYRWEELYWGGSEWKNNELTFDQFVSAYNDETIKL